MIREKMGYDAANQDILAQNIANADTPGFQAKEIRKVNFEKLAMIHARKLQLRATSASHLASPQAKMDFKVDVQKKTNETTPVKNTVVLEEQMAKMAYNQNDYLMLTNLYRKTAGMFKTAIGNSNG